MTLPKLSLLTACYNSSTTIGDTILSVNTQTYSNIEHIIIDGASSDSTVKIAKKIGKRINKITSESDDGIYDAYNKGLSYATGEIIGFINSDDFYCTETVCERVMSIFENPEVDACHANLVYVHADHTDRVLRYWKSRKITQKSLSWGFIPAHPTVFMRRKVYDKIGHFDLSYKLASDYEFLLRAFYKHRISSVYVPEIWVRMRAGGATGGSIRSILLQNEEIRAAQKYHGVKCSALAYGVAKVSDRLIQRIRGPFAPVLNKIVSQPNTMNER